MNDPAIPEPQRLLPIEGTHNFRDAGGYATIDDGAVRWRTLFRSDSLHALTDAGRRAISELGIRTVVDLRSDREIERWPSAFRKGKDVAYAHLPLNSGQGTPMAPVARDLHELNRMFLDNGQKSLAHILGFLARPGIFPAVIHCRIGKDRTGLLTALLLELAGVPRETVVEDYALTCPEIQQLLATETEIAVSDGRDRAQFERLMECDASVIARTLAYLDERYGGAERYARAIGFKDAALRSLRAALAQEP